MRFALFVLFAIVAWGSALQAGEQCRSTGEYEYTFGDDQSLVEARQQCEALALRSAIEQCALFVESTTSIENYSLRDDLVETIAIAFVKKKKVLESTVDGRLVRVVVSVVLDEDQMLKAIELERSRRAPSKPAGGAAATAAADPAVFFHEDFSDVEEGLLPEGWLGGATLAVRESGLRNRPRCLAPFSKGKHEFTVPNLAFPANWIFEMEMMYDTDPWCNAFELKVGEIGFKFYRNYNVGEHHGGQIFFNGIMTDNAAPPKNKMNLIVIEKKGDVLTLYVNTEKIHTIRVPGLSPPRGVSVSYNKSFCIYGMRARRS